MKNNKLLLGVVVALLLGVTLIDAFKPAPLSWELDFTNQSYKPFGSKALYELLPDFFNTDKIETVSISPYELLTDKIHLFYTYTKAYNYLILTDVFNPDESDSEKMLQFAAAGNHLFIAAETFGDRFAEKLQFQPKFLYITKDSVTAKFTQPDIAPDTAYYFPTKHYGGDYFSNYNLATTQVLSTINQSKPVLIRVQWENGFIYLSTLPRAFTNYYTVHPTNHAYAAGVLSYLPCQQTYWDEYYKPMRAGGKNSNQSPLRYVLSQPPLKWAVYLSVCTILMIVLVESKRTQRIIPVMKPLPNTTLQFVKTVSQLYFRHQNHRDLALKKIQYFMSYLKTKLYTRNVTFTDEFYRQLAHKTGLPENDIYRLFSAIKAIQDQPTDITEDHLLALCRNIDRFYRHTSV